MNNQNPYESPRSPNSSGKSSPMRILLAVALGFLTLPAAAIAFLVTCTGTYATSSLTFIPWVLGTLAGLAVAVPMVYVIIRLCRR